MPDKIATIDLEVASRSQTFDATFSTNEMTVEVDCGTIINLSAVDYEKLKNKPKINGVELKQNKSFNDLGLRSTTTLELIRMWNSVDD